VQKEGLINYVLPIYLGNSSPLQGVILFPLSHLDASCVHFPPVDAPVLTYNILQQSCTVVPRITYLHDRPT